MKIIMNILFWIFFILLIGAVFILTNERNTFVQAMCEERHGQDFDTLHYDYDGNNFIVKCKPFLTYEGHGQVIVQKGEIR